MKELFYQFLVENGALFNYLKYKGTIPESITQDIILDILSPTKFWESTDEGYNYWDKLDKKWVILFDEHMVEKFTTNK